MTVIKLVPKAKEDKKESTIEFLRGLIEMLERDNLDPEKCLVMCKWKVNDGLDQFNYYHNDINTESKLGIITLCQDKILDDTVRCI